MDGIEHPARLDVGIIGAGRVGAVLGAALARAGHRITGVYAVSDASRRRAADLLPEAPIRDVPAVLDAAELVVLAVPDDVLASLVQGLATAGHWTAGQVVVHTSGRHGVRILDPVLAAHALPLALHPAMTFTVWIAEEDRTAYHAALAHGANHLTTLLAQASDILRAAGVERPDHVLRPLVSAALDNALRLGDAALTGPVSRGDVGTVRDHLRELDRIAPDIKGTYVALARATALRAMDSGRLRPAAAEPLLDILADQEQP